MSPNELAEAVKGLSVEDAIEFAESYGIFNIRSFTEDSIVTMEYVDGRLNLVCSSNDLNVIRAYFG